ncbi:GPI mannosyltransferase 4 [Diorhabda sublineata]|uniref:GPI mannosyltransferase 4 n=1 Tax=Diorhabda sublineata TaxID=1163346 RepID=UPI0024E09188|nr:GPI mannosyltransferase 4 [Diorhabda sublineata]
MKKKGNNYNVYYYFLVLIRILLVFIPQTGYIHPDEFFQSLEVLAGKLLDVQCSPPWEFNVTTPIRSMTIPYFTMGLSYTFLRDANDLSKSYFNQALLTPYMLLTIPRFIMCLLTFLIDYCLYKICINNNEKYKSRLIMLASSYIIIIYGTRTFSNTIELILFSLLLYFVGESLIFNNTLLKKKDYINYRYEQCKTTADKAKFHKLKLYLVSDSYRNCFVISTITVFGFFNRPTFLAYSVIPIFFWLYRGIGKKTISPLTLNCRVLVFALCSIPSFLFNILVDSFYYGHITWGEIGMLDVTMDKFVFTPLNFLKYNSNLDNLAVHGLHPRFLHVLVNIPLLFNLLGIFALCTVGKYVYLCYLKKFNLLPSLRSIKCLMTLSFIVPLAALSIFPHQEPRFLIPLIFPLIYLYASSILPETDVALVEVPNVPYVTQSRKTFNNYSFIRIWLMLNFIFSLFYGFLHQGGVYQATEYLSLQMKVVPTNVQYNIITSHVYSIPESLFLQKSGYQLYLKGKKNSILKKKVFLYEEGSRNVSSVLEKTVGIIKSSTKQFKTFLLISGSLDDDLDYAVRKTNIRLYMIKKFSLHLSLEALPNLTTYCLEFTKFLYGNNCLPLPIDEYIKWLYSLFTLNLYRVELNN